MTRTESTESAETAARAPWISESHRLAGLTVLAVALAGWIAWFGWRVHCLGLQPICLAAFVLELLAAIGGLLVAAGLVAADTPRNDAAPARSDAHRFAIVIGDIVGRTRAIDLHHDVRWLARHARGRRHRTAADLAMAAVLLDGPRRLAVIVVATLGLLLGVPPIPMPPAWAVAAAAVAVAGTSLSLVLLTGGRVRLGDRTRWTFGSVGEIFARRDHEGLAPRRWVGAVATVVVVSLAVALRGMSDRWTHGLAPMGDADRRAAMAFGVLLVAGALYTLRTTASPQLANAHLVARRLEERTARQSAIGGAVAVGLIGLIAGVLPADVDTPDDDSVRVEDVSERDGRRSVDGAGDG